MTLYFLVTIQLHLNFDQNEILLSKFEPKCYFKPSYDVIILNVPYCYQNAMISDSLLSL